MNDSELRIESVRASTKHKCLCEQLYNRKSSGIHFSSLFQHHVLERSRLNHHVADPLDDSDKVEEEIEHSEQEVYTQNKHGHPGSTVYLWSKLRSLWMKCDHSWYERPASDKGQVPNCCQ